MSVVGFDLSTDNIRVAVIPIDNVNARDVVNRDSRNGIPAAVGFSGKNRIVGIHATKLENCFSDVLKIIGRKKCDLISNPQLSSLLKKGSNDLLVCVRELKPGIQFTPTQLLAMVLSELKAMAEISGRVENVEECCIAVPPSFSELQRTVVSQAAEIAGFNKVLLAPSMIVAALGHSIIHSEIHKKGTAAELFLGIVDVDSISMQVAIVRLTKQNLDVLSLICDSCTSDMTVLLQNAVSQAGVEKENINNIVVTGSGSNISVTEESLKDFIPEQAGAPKINVVSAAGFIARGCAILCATRSEAFKTRKDKILHQSMKDCLIKFEVTYKWPPVNGKIADFQVSQSINDGRVELTAQEISDARECERKMALYTNLKMKLSALLKLKEFAKEDEIVKLDDVNNQLDNDDLDKEYIHVTLIEKRIKARRYEHDNKGTKTAQLLKKIVDYENCLQSPEPIYRTIRKPAKDQLKEYCTIQRKWLDDKLAILSKQSKNDDPISFIEEATERIQNLEEAWAAVQLERQPDIMELTYNITAETFWETITDFRRQLLEGLEKKKILGCFLLPYQIEVGGIPMKWFQVKLIGRKNEFVTLHIKHHNAYIVGFSNMEGQPFEMGPANENDTGAQTDGINPEHQNAGPNFPGMIRLTIAGSQYVGFQCDYINMINPKNLEWSKAQLMKNIEKFRVSIQDWLDSIHVLAYYGCHPEHHEGCSLCKAPYAVRWAVMCISIMLNECTRMDALKEAVHTGILGMYLTEFLMRCIWLWRVMSVLLRRYAEDNNETEVSLKVSEFTKMFSIYGLAQIIHLILNASGSGKVTTTKDQGQSSEASASSDGNDGDKKAKGKRQDGTSSASDSGRNGVNKKQPQPPLGLGKKLLHIFSITTRRINPDDLGGILVHEEHGSHIIYSCGGNPNLSVLPVLNLCGPGMAISSEAGCILEVVPKTGNKHGASEDALVHLDDKSCYNQPRVKIMDVGAGKLTVKYAILTEAVEANLKIKMKLPLNGNRVHGFLQVTQQDGRTVLSLDPAEHTPVARQPVHKRAPVLGLPVLTRTMPVNVKLSRSVLAVRLGESIKVEGFLHVGNRGSPISEVLEVPNEVDILDNLKTPWKNGHGFSYSLSMMLTCRNI
ncbi:hypothetical protein ACQJBY_070647 [Aegilops geniculata]